MKPASLSFTLRSLLRNGAGARFSALGLGLLLTACSAPPLKLYTLAGPSVSAGSHTQGAVQPGTPVLEIRRVSLPDYLDGQDLITRDGSSLSRSPDGRWAERLSDGITDYLTAQIGAARPDLFVTREAPLTTSSSRLRISITRLDLPVSGPATLDATWSLVPANEKQEIQTWRESVSVSEAVQTDLATVHVTDELIAGLGQRILQTVPPRFLN